jgi:hypothetical protein
MIISRLHRLRAPSALAALVFLPLACTLSTAGIPGGVGGSGGSAPCKAGETRACFDGPADKAGKGVCKAGEQTCSSEGAWPSECPGQVLPLAMEECANALDDDCNGMVNDTCGCIAGEITSCYSGPAATRDVGACKSGSHVCNAEGDGFGPCMNEILPQPEDCANALDDDCDGALTICTGDPIFLVQSGTGSPIPDDDVGYAAAAGPNGTFAFGGVYQASLSIGGYDVTTGSALLLSVGADGSTIWTKHFDPNAGAGHHAVVRGVAVDKEGAVFAVGELAGHIDFGGGMLKSSGDSKDIFVLKLDKEGKHVWSEIFGDAATQSALAVAVDKEGSVYFTGVVTGTVDFGGGAIKDTLGDLFVAKLDKEGTHQWSRTFGDGNAQMGWSIAVTDTGKVVVAGDLVGMMDLGLVTLTSAGGTDAFVAQLDATTSDVLWAKRYGDLRDQSAFGVAVDPAGDIAIAGAFRGVLDIGGAALSNADPTHVTGDLFVARLDGGGNPIWAQRFGDTLDQSAESVAVDGAGNVVVTGSFVGTLAFGGTSLVNADPTQLASDLFVAKLRATDGSLLWARRFGDTSDQRGWALASSPSGNTAVTGAFRGSLPAGPPAGTATSVGDSDFFALGLAP